MATTVPLAKTQSMPQTNVSSKLIRFFMACTEVLNAYEAKLVGGDDDTARSSERQGVSRGVGLSVDTDSFKYLKD